MLQTLDMKKQSVAFENQFKGSFSLDTNNVVILLISVVACCSILPKLVQCRCSSPPATSFKHNCSNPFVLHESSQAHPPPICSICTSIVSPSSNSNYEETSALIHAVTPTRQHSPSPASDGPESAAHLNSGTATCACPAACAR